MLHAALKNGLEPMPLPLDDANNPLYKLAIEQQCQLVVQWQEKGISPRQLLSLPQQYSQEEINRAYRQLARRFHPDKNRGVASAEDAFKLICEAVNYVEYGLKSESEKAKAFRTIKNNPFYKAYDEPLEQNVSISSANFPTTQQRTQFRSKPHKGIWWQKTYEEMSYFELLDELYLGTKEDIDTLPVRMVAALKKHINHDLSLINSYQSIVNGQSSTIGQIVASFGDFAFLKWLIDKGADLHLMTIVPARESSKDIMAFIIEKGNISLLRYLFERNGLRVFYPEAESDNKNLQWWWFRRALVRHQIDVAYFLLDEVGFNRYVDQQAIGSFQYAMQLIKFILNDKKLSRPSTQEKKQVLQMARILLNHQEITLEFLYCGIIELLSAVEELATESRRYRRDIYFFKQAIFAFVNRLIKRLDIQVDDITAIQAKVPYPIEFKETENLRHACITSLYNSALRHGNYEILQHLLSISVPPVIDKSNRERLLWRCFSSCRDEGITVRPDAKIRQNVELAYQQILIALFDAGCFGSMDEHYNLKVYPNWIRKYKNYTLLHLVCETGWQKFALALIDRMPGKIIELNTPVLRKDIKFVGNGSTRKQRTYQRCLLHMAIDRDLVTVAVRLIEAGADLSIKEVVDKPSSNCCFSLFGKREYIEQTPLEMAIEKGQPQVIRAIQRAMLDHYIKQREQEEEYLSQFSFFGYVLFALGTFNLCGLIWGFGYSKTEKLEQAYAFRELLASNTDDPAAFSPFDEGAAQDGRLGEIVQLSQYYLREESHSVNNSLAI